MRRLSYTVRYLITGVIFGAFFPISATLLIVILSHLPLTIQNIANSQRNEPLLWIIDSAPLALGLAFASIGNRQDRLKKVNLELETIVASRTSDLRRANEELQREVEERRQTEAQIGNAKKEWELTFDAVNDLVFLTDVEDRIVRCNKAAASQLHVTIQELLNQPLSQVLYQTGSADVDWNQYAGGISFPSLPGWYDISNFEILVEGGEKRNLYILHDITARK